ALAISLVPAISEALALHKYHLLRQRAYQAIRMTLILAIPCAIGLYLLAEPICVLLYQNAEAGDVLAVLALGVIFLTLYQTTSAILQGLGKTMIPVINLFWGAVIKTSFTWSLTAWPELHVRGAAIATVLGFGVAALLNVYQVQKITDLCLAVVETIFKPLCAAAAMGVSVIYLYNTLEPMLVSLEIGAANQVTTLLSVMIGALIYLIGLMLLGGLSKSDLLLLPKIGPLLVRIAERLYLIRG
ncbi:MAG: polysaccharide biosynthesis protein, partial [Firmicutes bacterium]|nr:polysaccharide biosynthesis protein [Bacillota bacterium]